MRTSVLTAASALVLVSCGPGAPAPTPSAPLTVRPTASASVSPNASATPSSFGQHTIETRPPGFTPPTPVRCPPPTVKVSTVRALRQAIATVRAGGVIEVAPGTYRVNLNIGVRAREAEPVYVCGRGQVILDGAGRPSAPVIHFHRARSWRLVNLSLRQARAGVLAEQTNHVTLQQVRITQMAGQAVWWQQGSTDNLVRDAVVDGIGVRGGAGGQGVLVGTPVSHWCTPTKCEPDASDRNAVYHSAFTRTVGSAIEAYEGTYDGAVVGNQIDGAGMTGSDAWVHLQGSNWLIAGNSGRHSPRDGFSTQEISEGSGADNVFRANSGRELNERRSDGYLIALRPDRTERVSCDNVVPDHSAPPTNGTCIP